MFRCPALRGLSSSRNAGSTGASDGLKHQELGPLLALLFRRMGSATGLGEAPVQWLQVTDGANSCGPVCCGYIPAPLPARTPRRCMVLAVCLLPDVAVHSSGPGGASRAVSSGKSRGLDRSCQELAGTAEPAPRAAVLGAGGRAGSTSSASWGQQQLGSVCGSPVLASSVVKSRWQPAAPGRNLHMSWEPEVRNMGICRPHGLLPTLLTTRVAAPSLAKALPRFTAANSEALDWCLAPWCCPSLAGTSWWGRGPPRSPAWLYVHPPTPVYSIQHLRAERAARLGLDTCFCLAQTMTQPLGWGGRAPSTAAPGTACPSTAGRAGPSPGTWPLGPCNQAQGTRCQLAMGHLDRSAFACASFGTAAPGLTCPPGLGLAALQHPSGSWVCPWGSSCPVAPSCPLGSARSRPLHPTASGASLHCLPLCPQTLPLAALPAHAPFS